MGGIIFFLPHSTLPGHGGEGAQWRGLEHPSCVRDKETEVHQGPETEPPNSQAFICTYSPKRRVSPAEVAGGSGGSTQGSRGGSR